MLKKSADTKIPVVPLLRDEKIVELMDGDAQTRLVEIYTKEAVDFIGRNKDKPFYLYFAHNAVHTPIHPGAAFAGKSQNGRFGDWVEEVDWSVGQVLDALRSQGLDKDTLVVFTSDNGPWLIKGTDGGSAGPLRGGKGSTWEGGMREPTIAWWPGHVPAGSVNDAVAGTIDLLPTFVSLAGGTVPASPVIDGRDITPILLGQSKESAREAHYYFSGYDLQAVRQGRWKLALIETDPRKFEPIELSLQPMESIKAVNDPVVTALVINDRQHRRARSGETGARCASVERRREERRELVHLARRDDSGGLARSGPLRHDLECAPAKGRRRRPLGHGRSRCQSEARSRSASASFLRRRVRSAVRAARPRPRQATRPHHRCWFAAPTSAPPPTIAAAPQAGAPQFHLRRRHPSAANTGNCCAL
ncbi:MAG: hypothetical protein EBR83_06915 [Verrucomicrobia bacterium]|nr:hypothetical protein [Verrucomicrobiota bacterium]